MPFNFKRNHTLTCYRLLIKFCKWYIKISHYKLLQNYKPHNKKSLLNRTISLTIQRTHTVSKGSQVFILVSGWKAGLGRCLSNLEEGKACISYNWELEGILANQSYGQGKRGFSLRILVLEDNIQPENEYC